MYAKMAQPDIKGGRRVSGVARGRGSTLQFFSKNQIFKIFSKKSDFSFLEPANFFDFAPIHHIFSRKYELPPLPIYESQLIKQLTNPLSLYQSSYNISWDLLQNWDHLSRNQQNVLGSDKYICNACLQNFPIKNSFFNKKF